MLLLNASAHSFPHLSPVRAWLLVVAARRTVDAVRTAERSIALELTALLEARSCECHELRVQERFVVRKKKMGCPQKKELLLRLYSHESPSPYPPLPRVRSSDQTSPVSSCPVEDHWVGLPRSIIMGARRRNLRLARGSAESVCLRAHCYLHHAPPRPHTWPRTLTHPCMQPHFTPTSSPHTPCTS